MGLSLIIGIIAGCGAIIFHLACQIVVYGALDLAAGYRPVLPLGEPGIVAESETPFRPWILLLVAPLGGLLSGLIVFTFAPEAEGHGTDAAIAAYHYRSGNIRPRVPLIKIIASALTIGTGGSGGREGPIAQIGAGFGSYLGGLLKLRAVDRRVLMAAGKGAGVAAIFRAPLAGALFDAEVLYRSPDFESEVIIPAGLASVTAYCTFGLAPFGFGSLFRLEPEVLRTLTFDDPLQLASYLLLALFMIVLAMLYTRSCYGLTHLFHRLKIKPQFKPAIGAFMSIAVGLALYYLCGQQLAVLSVLSFGYGVLQEAMNVTPAVESLYFALALFAVAFGKILTTGLTIGSGGSGGVFGPSMVIGGCGGGALGIVLHWIWPSLVPHPAAFVIVGMAGFFAAAAKTPFSTLVIVSEMTGNYNLLLPTLRVCAIAFLLSDEQSIYRSQVESRSRSPAHQGDYVREVLTGLTIDKFLTPIAEVPALHAGDRLRAVVERLSEMPYNALPVIDAEGRLLGVVTFDEVLLATQSPHLAELVVAADLMRTGVTPLRSQDRLDVALELFVESDLLALPVIESTEQGRVIGIVKRADVSGTYLRHVQGMSETTDGTALPA
jgi:CIC family chloride channel protein